MRLGDRGRRVDSEGARAPIKVLEIKDRHYYFLIIPTICYQLMISVPNMKMLNDIFHAKIFSRKGDQSGNLCMGRTSWRPQPRGAPMLSSFRTQGIYPRICDIQIHILILICNIFCKL